MKWNLTTGGERFQSKQQANTMKIAQLNKLQIMVFHSDRLEGLLADCCLYGLTRL